ncbi:MAG: DUF4124 domain-containing protein [Gammaproteobacteria bacterium]|nr:DUF4124 domain-containing protein [Gammaproteobacteria bacterium]MBU1962311.1 DUF4124 domain-containing protein [Gammaproteobacteria bacterium]
MNMKLLPILAISLLVCPPLQAAKLYRWVDDQGKVFYSDKVPPSEVQHKLDTLNQQGVVVERTEAAKTKEELAREAELEKRRLEQQHLIEEQKKADRVLLRTFRAEDDIFMARNGKLASIDAKIQIVRGNIRRQKIRLAELQFAAASMERAGQAVSSNQLQEIENIRNQINNDYQGIISQEELKQQIREKYASDLARFRELRNLRPEQGVVPERSDSPYSLLDTLVACSSACDELWQKAELYVREHASTRMQLLGRSIIMTHPPIKDQDISLTVSRIKREGAIEEFFLDIQCKDNTLGDEFCKSATVQEIRKGFRGLGQGGNAAPEKKPAEGAGTP